MDPIEKPSKKKKKASQHERILAHKDIFHHHMMGKQRVTRSIVYQSNDMRGTTLNHGDVSVQLLDTVDDVNSFTTTADEAHHQTDQSPLSFPAGSHALVGRSQSSVRSPSPVVRSNASLGRSQSSVRSPSPVVRSNASLGRSQSSSVICEITFTSCPFQCLSWS
ncbi:hypothetical protein EMCRGX_G016228 [Ephydatia muelleri]